MAKKQHGGHQPPKPLDPKVLLHLYHGEKISLRAIGKRLGCSHEHVRKEMQRHGIAIRNPAIATQLHSQQHPPRPDLDTPTIATAYRDGATTGELAEEYDVHIATIRERLDDAGVEREFSRRRPGLKRPDVDSQAILEDYCAGLSVRDVAEAHNTTPMTVVNRLKAMGKPRRPPGDTGRTR